MKDFHRGNSTIVEKQIVMFYTDASEPETPPSNWNVTFSFAFTLRNRNACHWDESRFWCRVAKSTLNRSWGCVQRRSWVPSVPRNLETSLEWSSSYFPFPPGRKRRIPDCWNPWNRTCCTAWLCRLPRSSQKAWWCVSKCAGEHLQTAYDKTSTNPYFKNYLYGSVIMRIL